MKACFQRAASRPTGTFDAALIFILGANELVAHRDVHGSVHMHFMKVFFIFFLKCVSVCFFLFAGVQNK